MLSAWVGVNDVFVAETLAREDFDAVTLDMQHGGIDFVGAARAIQAIAAAGKPTVARVPVGDFATASRLADAGAAAVIAPMINSARGREAFRRVPQIPAGRRALLGTARRAFALRPARRPTISKAPIASRSRSR